MACVVLFQCAHSFERRGGDDIESEDVKACVNQLVAQCQTSMMLLIAAQDKATAADDLKQCISTNAGLATVCDTIVSSEGTLQPQMQAAMTECGAQAMRACPAETMLATSAAITASRLIKSGQELDATSVQQLWTKASAVFTCLKKHATQLSQTCQLISDDDIADAMENMGIGDEDSPNAAEKPSKTADGDSGGGLVFVGVACFVVAVAAAGITYLIMRRRQQAQLLHAQLEGQQPQASAAAVVVTSTAQSPTYDPVPVKSPINNV